MHARGKDTTAQVYGPFMHGILSLSTNDELSVWGSHLHRHVALHRTHHNVSASRPDNRPLPAVYTGKSCPPIGTLPAWIEGGNLRGTTTSTTHLGIKIWLVETQQGFAAGFCCGQAGACHIAGVPDHGHKLYPRGYGQPLHAEDMHTDGSEALYQEHRYVFWHKPATSGNHASAIRPRWRGHLDTSRDSPVIHPRHVHISQSCGLPSE